MKRALWKLAAMFAALSPTAAWADGLVTGVQIAGVISDGSVVRISTTGTKTGGPACNPGPQFAVQASNTNLVSMVMTAYAQAKTVTIGGSGACTYHAATENMTFIQY